MNTGDGSVDGYPCLVKQRRPRSWAGSNRLTASKRFFVDKIHILKAGCDISKRAYILLLVL